MKTENKRLVFSITKKDLRIDTFGSGGPGGQNQNKRSTGIRITHTPTGLSSESRVHRTQEQNKKEAFKKLADKLIDFYLKKEQKQRFAAGTEVIRTYHEPDDRVTDHRTKKSFSYKHTIGKGDMSQIIESR